MASSPEAQEQADAPRLLLLWWSQTGQLRKAAEAFVTPLADAGWGVRRIELRPSREYPFPWRPLDFFSVFPETVSGPPPSLAAIDVDPDERFDLVVLAYQVWFLAPSPPVQALFATPLADVLRGTPVITLVACRNMWYSAAARLRGLLDRTGARFAGNVAAIDESPAWATFVMTPRWLMTGRTDPILGMPSPGIGEAGFDKLSQAGKEVARTTATGRPPALPEDSAAVDPQIALADRLGGIAFRGWARAIRAMPRRLGMRTAALVGFVVWLAASIVTVLPVVALLHRAFQGRIDRRTFAWVERALRPGVDG